MYIGLGIFLLVVGAIITFAYTGDASLGGVLSVHAVGWICIIAGILAILFGIVLLIFPGGGIIGLIWLLGIYAILFGVLLIAVAFQARKVAKEAGVTRVINELAIAP